MKIKTGLIELLTGKRNLLDELTFIIAVITLIIGLFIAIDSVRWVNIVTGILILLSGVAGVLTVVIPLPKLRDYVDISSFVILVYGLFNTSSLVAKTISYQAILSLIILFTIWKFAVKRIYKKRGE